MIRILVVEDHAMVRAGLRAVIDQQDDLQVVGEAGDGRSALQEAARLKPDLLLLDLTLPELDGIEVLRRMSEVSPATRTVVLSMHYTSDHVRPALAAGAAGYVTKGAGLEDLVTALRSVAAGEPFLGAEATRVVESCALTTRDAVQRDVERLTPREVQVLRMVALGYTNADIARVLGVNHKTADAHRTNLMRKLDLHDAQGVTRYAVRNGLVPLG